MKLLFALLSIFILPQLAYSTQIYTRGMEQVTADQVAQGSSDIFCGACIDAKPETPTAPNFRTIYTFTVKDVAKGDLKAGETTSWKQATGFKGATTFEVGKDYCVALGPASIKGVRAPYGVFFGKWDIQTGTDGTRKVRGVVSRENFYRNVIARQPALSKSLTSREKDTITRTDNGTRDIDYDVFVSTIREINESTTR